MGNISNNTWNTQTEKSEVGQKKSEWTMVNKAIKAFIKSKLNQWNNLDYYNAISEKLDSFFSDEFKKEFIKYIEWNKDFKDIKIEEIENKKGVFVEEIMSFWVPYESKRNALKEIIKREYEDSINNIDASNTINYNSNKLSIKELEEIIWSWVKRDLFIKKIFKNNIPEKKDFLSFMENLKIDYKKLNEEQIEALVTIKNWNYINQDQLKQVLSLFKKDLEAKQNIIKSFMPTISLQKLIDLWIITNKEADNSLEKLINENEKLMKFKAHLTDEKWILEKINYEDIIIPTYLFPENVLDNILYKDWLHVLEKEYNKIIDENNSKDEINKFKLDNQWKITPDFIKKVQENPNLANKISGIEKLKNWVIFKTIIGEPWQEQVWYFRIDEIDTWVILETKTLKITNLTKAWWIVKNADKLDWERITYDVFYKFLEKSKKWIFVEKENFEEEKKAGKITEEIEDNEINSLEDLNQKLDEIDDKWTQFKAEVWMSFETINSGAKWWEYWVFSISKINKDSKQIWITNWQNEEWPFSFAEFFSWFKNQTWKRFISVKNQEWFLNAVQNHSDEKTKKWFKDIMVSDNKFIPQNRKDDKDFEWIKYFVGKDWESLHIEEIKDWKVKLSTWKYTEWLPKKDSNEKEADTYKWSKSSWVWYEMMYYFIQKNKCVPKIPEKPVEKENDKSIPSLKMWLFKSWIAGKSVFDLVKWWKQFIDAIKHNLEQWSKLKASQFAYSLWKAFHLPEDMLLNLKSSAEKADKWTMEEIVNEIGNLGWIDRIKRIRTVLLNWGSQSYEMQAILIVTLKKYWNLYPGSGKDFWLNQYRWSYLWYKRFWWKVNDDFFLKTKKDLEANWEQFTEESLLREYFKNDNVKEQLNLRHLFWIDVRSAWKEWRDSQVETWDKDTNALLTTNARIKYAIWKIKWWEYYHVVSALKNIWWKGWSAVEMNKIPFILLMGWITKNLSQDEIKILKNNFIWWLNFPALWFIDSGDRINLFQDVVLKLSKWTDAENDAKEIVKMERTWDYDKEKFIEKISKFWDNHWGMLSPKLTMTKDPEIFLKKDESGYEEYKIYHDSIRWIMTWNDFKIDQWQIWNDIYNYDHSSMAITWIRQFMKKWVRMQTNWKISNESWEKIFDSVIEWLKDIKNLKIDKDEKKNEEYKKIMFKEYYGEIYSFLIKESIDIAKFNRTEYGRKLRHLWLIFDENKDVEIESDWFKKWKYDFLINKAYVSYNDWWPKDKDEPKTKKITNIFEWKIDNIIEKLENPEKHTKSKKEKDSESSADEEEEYDFAWNYY